ncbi:DUF4124 domain-containing protein [Caenimonas koreensis DSM 17982]|uniref:DUF4124 domain-containing protein n=1 Tax=Caenimonas koreensis DSM 17982 TaxID=1121255 RepID=A0A844BBY0_9BURK|nr:DUF4124 domain-containing protein [Caenimonas koreensis]MRD49076.1 DUF4124 domain-containing protein [Caenimonas koreensis DSM 17982]
MAAPAWAQQGIYTCVDGKGRRITADRPIPECIDREQAEMSSGGLVVRKIGPSLTAQERAQEEAKAAKAQEERNRQAEERRRERVLLARYPDKASHDKERAQALAQLDDVINAANRHNSDLATQRKAIDQELEFYKGDPSRIPPKLKRQIEENTQQAEGQRRFVANQEAEKKRVNARFDDELVKLKALWSQLAAPTSGGAASAATATTAAASGPVTQRR